MRLREPADDARLWIVAYDIGDDRRRAKVARLLVEHGRRIQKSVFEVELATAALRELLVRLTPYVHARDDRVDVVPVCAGCRGRRRRLGAARDAASGDWVVIA